MGGIVGTPEQKFIYQLFKYKKGEVKYIIDCIDKFRVPNTDNINYYTFKIISTRKDISDYMSIFDDDFDDFCCYTSYYGHIVYPKEILLYFIYEIKKSIENDINYLNMLHKIPEIKKQTNNETIDNILDNINVHGLNDMINGPSILENYVVPYNKYNNATYQIKKEKFKIFVKFMFIKCINLNNIYTGDIIPYNLIENNNISTLDRMLNISSNLVNRIINLIVDDIISNAFEIIFA